MAGSSDQEDAAKKQYGQVSAYNPTVKNRYDNMNLFDYKQMSDAADKYTAAGSNAIKKNTATNVKEAGSGAAAGAQSRGYGGSILEDMIAKAKNKAASGGQSALTQMMLKRLGMVPSMMQTGNQNIFQQAAGGQAADFGNVQNMFNKFGAQNNAISGLDDSTWFDDLLGVGTTVGGFL
jgi:hypothetical protein